MYPRLRAEHRRMRHAHVGFLRQTFSSRLSGSARGRSTTARRDVGDTTRADAITHGEKHREDFFEHVQNFATITSR